ncbi:MAG: twitching motility protein PilT [Flaviaesturariibacter sp.]|nr:twitching motility protein PilT [Flaviaesturariibacter sp.]
MSGIKYFLDTNAIIAFLGGNEKLNALLADAAWIGTSSIAIIEFLSFSHLDAIDSKIFQIFISRIHVDAVSTNLLTLQQIADIRREHKFKLPDAIIVAQSITNNAVLISNDKQLKAFTNQGFGF